MINYGLFAWSTAGYELKHKAAMSKAAAGDVVVVISISAYQNKDKD